MPHYVKVQPLLFPRKVNGETMSTTQAKKLIEDGLRNLQEGFTKLFEVIESLENGDESNEADSGHRPLTNLAEQIRDSAKKKSVTKLP